MENLSMSCEKMSLLEQISHLMDSKEMSDVTFVVGKVPNHKTFHCHRLFFAMRSDVFLAMFYGALPEKKKVDIIDMEPDTFENVRRYIYTDKMVPKNMDEAIKTYFAANKYNLVKLMELCDNYIEKNLAPNNVCQTYNLAFYLDKLHLKTECEKIIKKNHTDILNSKGFVKTTTAVVMKILQEDLTERNELFIFQCVLKWAKEECERQCLKITPVNMREVLNPILPHVRFLNMTHADFVKGPATSDILDSEEILSILMNIGIPGSKELPSWCQNAKNTDQYTTAVLTLSK